MTLREIRYRLFSWKKFDDIVPDKKEIDVVIPVTNKDLHILPLCLEGVRNCISNPVRDIYIVAKNTDEIVEFCANHGTKFVDETKVLGFGPEELNIVTKDNVNRSGWLFQQLLKLSGSIGTCENYLCIDADHVLIRKHTFVDSFGTPVFYMSYEQHEPYYRNIRNLLPNVPLTDLSYVAHKMIFNRKKVMELHETIQKNNNVEGTLWWEKIVNSLDLNTHSGFSEFETYGNFVKEKLHRPWLQKRLPYSKMANYTELREKYAGHRASLTFPDYMKQNQKADKHENGWKQLFTLHNLFILGFLLAFLATFMEVMRHRNTNYFDYYDSTMMFWQGLHAYTKEYTEMFHIYFLYSPVFSVLFAPIFFLPWWLGPFVWNLGNYVLFFLSIKWLPARLKPYRIWIFLFLLSVLLQAIFCYQYNTVVCYIFLFAFILLEKNKPFWAVLLIMISATTKVYGVVELGLLFCYPKVWRNFAYALLCGIGLLMLPALFAGLEGTATMYQGMFDMITNHHSDTDFVGILFAPGLKPFLLPNYRLVQLVTFGFLLVAFFCNYRRWGDFRFRIQVLAVLMGFIILFSDCPETHTYLIALSGYALAFWLQDKRTWYDWVLLWMLVVNFCILPTDVLCPAWLHDYVHRTFYLDVYTFALAWLRLLYLALCTRRTNLSGTKIVGVVMFVFAFPTLSEAQNSKDFIVNVNDVKVVMKWVRGGSFEMGDSKGEKDELPIHSVQMNDYYLSETEVTQELWTAIMGKKNPSCYKGEKLPVDRVTWKQCKLFIERLNQLTGRSFRLPTEAEWEYAARGGAGNKGFQYAGSNRFEEVAWCSENVFLKKMEGARTVKTKRPNELGIYDMSGNVWEWCEDFYGCYDTVSQKNPKGPGKGLFHVIRGGSWRSSKDYLRVSNRFMLSDWRFEDNVGFRLAL